MLLSERRRRDFLAFAVRLNICDMFFAKNMSTGTFTPTNNDLPSSLLHLKILDVGCIGGAIEGQGDAPSVQIGGLHVLKNLRAGDIIVIDLNQ